jgi:hypothetical protein
MEVPALKRLRYNSHHWTGDPDHVEAILLPMILLVGAVAILIIGLIELPDI